MFFLDEIEKLLELLASGGGHIKDLAKMRVTLPDIERIDVDQMQLSKRVPFPSNVLSATLAAQNFIPFDDIVSDRSKLSSNKHISTDNLFLQLINNLLLKQIELTPKREYPSAKLIISDQYSYDLLIKLKRLVSFSSKSLTSTTNRTKEARNFIHSSQFNVTAVFRLDEIVDAFMREQDPLVLFTTNPRTKQKGASFNYQLVRKIFPSLRMADLILLMQNASNLQLGVVSLKGDQTHLVIQLLNHYARSTKLIELSPIDRNLGFLHHLYDNVLVYVQPSSSSNDDSDVAKRDLKFRIPQLNSIAQRLINLAAKLRLNLIDITYRTPDLRQLSKVFAQLVKTNLQPTSSATFESLPTRVLVMDRFYNLQASMAHADTYGAFLEQERPTSRVENRQMSLRYDICSELDVRLSSVHLSEVLGSILKYALSLQPASLKNRDEGKQYIPKVNKSLMSTLLTSQSIRRHLDIVKHVYKSLNEGYLLVLRIESTLQGTANLLHDLKEPLTQVQQEQLSERLDRVVSAFKQLLKISGESIKSVDIVRTACMLIYTINLFLAIHDKNNYGSTKACRTLYEVRHSLLRGKDFKTLLKNKTETGEKVGQLIDKLNIFDRISRENYVNQGLAHNLEQVLTRFVANQIDTNSFSNIALAEQQPNEKAVPKTIILVFLGTITPKELGEIKSLETSLKQTGKVRDILIIAHSLDIPSNFLMALE